MAAQNRSGWGGCVPWPARVTGRWQEAEDTWTLSLEAPEGFAFRPGQFNMLYAFGIGEVPISISSDPDDAGRLLHTIRDVGAVSRALCMTEEGGMLGVRGPYGTGWPLDQAEGGDVLVVAGGLGLAPLRPVLYQLMSRRDQFSRVTLLYGTRSPAAMIFRDELQQWRARFDMDVDVTMDFAGDDWHGRVGVVTTLIPHLDLVREITTAFICGPEVMMRFVLRALQERGLNEDRLYVSMERNMQCATGLCGHCQFGPEFICRDGPVFSYASIRHLLAVGEV